MQDRLPSRVARVTRRPLAGALAQVLPGAALITGLMLSGAALATTFTVTTTADSGAGSLRDAIAQANAASGVDTIAFAPGATGTIALTTGPLTITEALNLQGPGPTALTIDGGGSSGVFVINPTLVALTSVVTLSGLTIQNGAALAGGGVMAYNTSLTMSDCVVTGNTATTYGGGVAAMVTASKADGGGRAVATVDHCTISDNTVAASVGNGGGGGIFAKDSLLTLNQSIISGNASSTIGGGVLVSDAGSSKYTSVVPSIDSLIVTDSRISNNAIAAVSDQGQIAGAGIAVHGIGNVTVTGSTLADNQLTSTLSAPPPAIGGGMIFLGSGPQNQGPVPGVLTLSDSTVSGNTIQITNGGSVTGSSMGAGLVVENVAGSIINSTLAGNNGATYGGGLVWVAPPGFTEPMIVANSTIAGNSASAMGGGVVGMATYVLPQLSNTIVAGNSATAYQDLVAMGLGTAQGTHRFDVSYSLIQDQDALSSINDLGGNVLGQPALLRPLADNGGPTWTMLTLTGSLALNAGDPAFTTPPANDQRGAGFPRIINGRVDIGAVERYTDVIFQDGFDSVRDLIFRNGFD